MICPHLSITAVLTRGIGLEIDGLGVECVGMQVGVVFLRPIHCQRAVGSVAVISVIEHLAEVAVKSGLLHGVAHFHIPDDTPVPDVFIVVNGIARH